MMELVNDKETASMFSRLIGSFQDVNLILYYGGFEFKYSITNKSYIFENSFGVRMILSNSSSYLKWQAANISDYYYPSCNYADDVANYYIKMLTSNKIYIEDFKAIKFKRMHLPELVPTRTAAKKKYNVVADYLTRENYMYFDTSNKLHYGLNVLIISPAGVADAIYISHDLDNCYISSSLKGINNFGISSNLSEMITSNLIIPDSNSVPTA